MHKKCFKERITGLIMPSAFAITLIICYSIYAPSLLFHPMYFLSLSILIVWAIVEVLVMQGDSKIEYNFLDWVFKVGGLTGLIFGVIFRNLNHIFIIYLGFFILISGIIIRYWAMKTLGIYFSYTLKTERHGQRVLDYGVYKYIRHPSYLGIFLIIISFPIIHASLVGFLVVLFFTCPWIIKRISQEEKMMIDAFDGLYEAYKRKTKKIIPFIF